MSRRQAIQKQFASLSRVDKTLLIVLLVRVAYAVIGATTDFPLPVVGLVRVLFIIVVTIAFLTRIFPPLVRRVLWRVRHRLLVTWALVGLIPIVLICLLVGEGLFILMGQVAGYMTTSEVSRQSDLILSKAQALASTVTHRGPSVPVSDVTTTFIREMSEIRKAEVGAIVRTAKETFAVPSDGSIREIPGWSKPDFAGLIKADERYYLAADVVLGDPADRTEAFLYQYAPAEFFANLLPNVATVVPVQGSASVEGVEIKRTDRARNGISFPGSRQSSQESDPDIPKVLPPAAARGWWDRPVRWFMLMPGTDLTTGARAESIAIVVSRPSLIVRSLFNTPENGASFALALVIVIFTAAILLVVELVSLLFGAKLTRSITGAVADLHEGTQKVRAGDFSHRIPLRTKDQLSELARSFNSMTERIQHLIVEVKEKERLENELEIARDVQSRLFPKEFPKLKTLEVFGACQPARTVSGDYYDFVLLGSDRVALAIGDISGKGISAALLMAHIQSALRSQLMNGSATSPSGIISILNNHVYDSSPPEKYATFFLGLYSHESGRLLYTNAGHLAPMLVRRGKVLRLAGDGFPVGMFPGAPYEEQSIDLEPGDLLVGFTDGVTETPNRDGEEFGDQRLTELLRLHAGEPLQQIATEIGASVAAWAGDVERHDDTTLVLARRL